MDKVNSDLIGNYLKDLRRYQEYEKKFLTFNRAKEGLVLYSLKETDPNYSRLVQYNNLVGHRHLTQSNSAKVIENAKDFLFCIVQLIKKAKKFIHIEYYIFSEGYVLNYLLELLAQKIQEGVEVKLIIDHWGNYFKITKKTKKRIKALGIKCKIFNPLFTKNNELWWNFRNHNKLLVVDNQYALFGSCNISDEYFNITDKFFPTSELAILLEGEIVNSLNILFAFHWGLIPNKKEEKEWDMLMDSQHYFGFNYQEKGNLELQLVPSSPLLEERPIKTNLLNLILSAKKIIRFTTPYFYPPKDILNALKFVSSIGVRIQIILPKEADLKDKVLRVHRKLLSSFSSKNIEIYEYLGFNHEKVTIIDDEIVYFGTYNWDYRSLYLNFESAILIKDKELGEKMKILFLKRLKNSHLITPSDCSYKNKVLPNIFTSISKWCQLLA
ncbi:cardiolipin synthase [Mycoplasma wenyonii str. Massachusetts]|uniref:Cardiolipin synthase n=1 Tax=Mycoplasma wenyonii (strain Massachusetts) TaxID=1197325 RepID=I6Z5K4_MYCWM|nr:phosphatidylserine/phosphatidylglycerophosphate/cardiolipin synthase family protein [Mycoplasma wenyonii]AFN64823.1 cardiolipin synthase [Mycoplasma wenyonii str. Massachusetts]